MTAKEAKEKTLYFWRYIAAHPEIDNKNNLPEKMLKEMKQYKLLCPLCQYQVDRNGGYLSCKTCVLGGVYSCFSFSSLFGKWKISPTIADRQKAANAIVAKVEAWEVEK